MTKCTRVESNNGFLSIATTINNLVLVFTILFLFAQFKSSLHFYARRVERNGEAHLNEQRFFLFIAAALFRNEHIATAFAFHIRRSETHPNPKSKYIIWFMRARVSASW